MASKLQINLYPLSGECNESKAAISLRDSILYSIPENTSGTIDILSGVNIPFGQVSDIDILVIAQLENCSVEIDDEKINVKSFCTAIELKEQEVFDVYVTSTDVYVNYPSSNEKKNASDQNRNQKYTLLNFCNKHGFQIFLSNILWLKSISSQSWEEKNWETTTPLILSTFDFKDIISQINKSGQRFFNSTLNSLKLYQGVEESDLTLLLNSLTQRRPVAPAVLREKTESIVRGILKKESCSIIKSEGFQCIDGKAGTGKTFLLLQTALRLSEEGYSCALLTYNNALTLDLKRLVSFIPSNPDARSNLTICTLHSFIGDMTKKFGFTPSDNFDKFKDYLLVLCQQNDNKPLAAKAPGDFDDYVFIDEAQDCSPTEKSILECIFGGDHIIVAKSALQKVRRNTVAHWGPPTVKLKFGLRQKHNIISFIQSLTTELDISDTCVSFESARGLEGGKVIITTDYTTDLHTYLENHCEQSGCSNYDILILVPPSQVKNNQFIKADMWREKGKIKLIDGTDTKAMVMCNPQELIDCCRIFQYESCRGLEGWVTVCYKVDEFTDYKFKNTKSDFSVIESGERSRWQQVYQWLMMPLTRPIDTLVITVSDVNSDIALKLKRAAEHHEDFVDCRI